MKDKILISFSGGRTSAYMAYWMLHEWADRDKHDMIVVFANTGKEREETLQFVDRCDKHFNLNTVWIETVMNEYRKGATAKVVTFETASRNGEPFEAVIAKHGIPNTSFPHCTRELKAVPIRAYARSIGWNNYHTAIGIRADEPKRLNWDKAKKERMIYPLALENRSSRFDVAHFWAQQPFDLELTSYQGNCDLCWKKSKRKLLTILQEDITLANWWLDMELKYQNFTPATRVDKQVMQPPIRFYRQNESILDLTEESSLPFPRALDESKEANRLLLMREWNEEYDMNSGCSESCEVF